MLSSVRILLGLIIGIWSALFAARIILLSLLRSVSLTLRRNLSSVSILCAEVVYIASARRYRNILSILISSSVAGYVNISHLPYLPVKAYSNHKAYADIQNN